MEEGNINKAIALKYDPDENNAPKVVAKGKGLVAGNIIETAIKSGVPVYKNQALAGMLMLVELDREIPPELYYTVAEVLAYIYSIDKKAKRLEK